MVKTSTLFWSGALTGALCFAAGVSIPRTPAFAELPAGTYSVHSVSWQLDNQACTTILELSNLGAGASSSRRFARVRGDVRVQPGQLVQVTQEANDEP